MKQYLLSVHYVEGDPELDAETMDQMGKDVDALNAEMRQQGVWVFGAGVETPDLATVVRDQDGQIVTTDGPFPEAKEQIAGFWILKTPNDQAARAWAAKASRACLGPVEVRVLDVAEE